MESKSLIRVREMRMCGGNGRLVKYFDQIRKSRMIETMFLPVGEAIKNLEREQTMILYIERASSKESLKKAR